MISSHRLPSQPGSLRAVLRQSNFHANAGSAPLRFISFLLVLLFLAACTPAQTPPIIQYSATATLNSSRPTGTAAPSSEVRPELERYFSAALPGLAQGKDLQGAFVLFDARGKRYIRYNPQLSAERFLPASTFKILNSMIGLETGVIPDENYVIHWDGTHYPTASWNQDHSMKTAFQNSVVWYYQELVRRVGKEKMQYYLDTVHYGNQDLSGRFDSFWLDGGLRISPDEQIAFLQRLYRGDLPFSQRSMKLVKEMMLLEKTEAYQYSGKTGATQMGELSLGWFVGYLEEKGGVYFFATFIEGPDPEVNGTRAKAITKEILKGIVVP